LDARVGNGLFIAATEHGPSHGVALIGLLAIAVVAALVYVVRHRRPPVADRSERAGSPIERATSHTSSAAQPTPSLSADHRSGPLLAFTQTLPRNPVVTATSLSKEYGELLAVADLTFALEPGTVTGFLGPNGAGKTTTLRLLLGLAEPSAGEALVFGRRYRELDQPARRVGAVLESNDLHPGRSGRDHLRALAIAAQIAPRRVDEVLELVELAPDAERRVRTYSLGMRQRLGLAAALLGDPELLILDEPANGLDPAGVHWLRTFLRGFADAGRTVLVASHLLAEVAQTVDQILIIDRGRLLASSGLDELTSDGRTLEDVYLELTAARAS
jgi:ABC-2 type transport system ATP-binding protein